MEYLTILGVAILVSIIIGFYIFYCRLNDSNTRVKELERNIRILDETKGVRPGAQELQGSLEGQGLGGQGGLEGQGSLEGLEGLECIEGQGQKSRSDKKTVKGVDQDAYSKGQNKQKNGETDVNQSVHGSIVGEKRNPVSICANSEPSEDSNNYTNYAPIPDEIDNIQLSSIENMSEYPVDLLS
jgi:hypothetical protein